ncbi:hypothetical protein [Haloprofundus salinisoli]|uniref:hypothetical protein n=1 Tax=Haloprofundus salinisoli TaxID=2876193 RepID=UPI001CC9F819|nr:hypothetical protein [Haloprofundus salinisoli]
MPTDRDSPSADWRRVYEAMGVDDEEENAEERLDDARIDAYAEEADSKESNGDEATPPESENGPTRREGHA